MNKTRMSLCDILGSEYCSAVSAVSSYTMNLRPKQAARISTEKVPFYDNNFRNKLIMIDHNPQL